MNEFLTLSPLVVLTGAGASKWLGKATTYDMYEADEFRELCRSAPCSLLAELRDSLPQHGATEPVDLEFVLDYGRQLTSELDLLRSMPSLGAYGPQMSHIRDQLGQAYEQALDFMVEYYGNVDRERSAALYGPFFDGLRGLMETRVIPLFTLNYDEAVESAVDELPGYRLLDGFRAGHRPVWRRDEFDNFAATSDGAVHVALFKLHGSVCWTRSTGSDRIEKTVLMPRRRPGREHILLYPTRSRKPIDQEPFATAYQYFDEALTNARLAVFIGTSFRDAELLEVIRRASDWAKPYTLIAVGPDVNSGEVASRAGLPRERVRAVSMSFQPDQIPILFTKINTELSSGG